jgi:hypothetical protein
MSFRGLGLGLVLGGKGLGWRFCSIRRRIGGSGETILGC